MPRSKPTIVNAETPSDNPAIVKGTLKRATRAAKKKAALMAVLSSSDASSVPALASSEGSTPGSSSTDAPSRQPARVAYLLAFAYKIQEVLKSQPLLNRAAVARRMGLTRARITQILDLTLLAPDIQEAILFLEAIDGVEPLSEHTLRSVVRSSLWEDQRKEWARIVEMSPQKHDRGL